MFYVSYAKDGADAHSRPVTFAFNGGPGSASLWLHMGALGPKRAPMNDDGSLPAPPYQAIDNADTWLDFTVVVVIDAPATGFSRLVKPELDASLEALGERVTKLERAAPRVARQIPPLAGGPVGVEGEARRVVGLKQHGPRVRPVPDGGQHHRVRLGKPSGHGVVEPPSELGHRRTVKHLQCQRPVHK